MLQFNKVDDVSIRSDRLITNQELCCLTGLSRSTSYNKTDRSNPYYDPDFPVRISIGRRAVRYSLIATLRWIHLKKLRAEQASFHAEVSSMCERKSVQN